MSRHDVLGLQADGMSGVLHVYTTYNNVPLYAKKKVA